MRFVFFASVLCLSCDLLRGQVAASNSSATTGEQPSASEDPKVKADAETPFSVWDWLFAPFAYYMPPSLSSWSLRIRVKPPKTGSNDTSLPESNADGGGVNPGEKTTAAAAADGDKHPLFYGFGLDDDGGKEVQQADHQHHVVGRNLDASATRSDFIERDLRLLAPPESAVHHSRKHAKRNPRHRVSHPPVFPQEEGAVPPPLWFRGESAANNRNVVAAALNTSSSYEAAQNNATESVRVFYFPFYVWKSRFNCVVFLKVVGLFALVATLTLVLHFYCQALKKEPRKKDKPANKFQMV